MLYLLITGASSGLGEALAEVATEEQGATVVGLSRRGNAALTRRATARNATYVDYRFDLADTGRIGEIASALFGHLRGGMEDGNDLILVNNAAVEGPIGRLGAIDGAGLIDHFSINLTAAILLAGEFIRFTAEWGARRTIVNITSGAAQHPYDGMSAYCASKAGLDMFGRCVALEQRDLPNPVRVLGIAPGVLDTQMQDRLRAAPDGEFSAKERFVALKRDGKLVSPLDAARRILPLVREGNFESGSVVDLRSLQ